MANSATLYASIQHSATLHSLTRCSRSKYGELFLSPNNTTAMLSNGGLRISAQHGATVETAIAVREQDEKEGGGQAWWPELSAWSSVKHERWEGDLDVEGEIPTWLNGAYLRNGPGLFHIGNHHFKHLFDGYSTLVRLAFKDGKLRASHAQLQSDAYQAAVKNGKPCFREFADVLDNPNPFSAIGELAGMAMGTTLTDNANTGVVRLGDGRVVCFTETVKGSMEIDPDTLQTLGRFTYDDNNYGLVHCPHPYVSDEEMINLLPDLINGEYAVARMPAGTNSRQIFARVKCRASPPGWTHSFGVTENYVVIPEMPLRYSTMNLLKSEPCPYFKFDWKPNYDAFMHVVSRTTGQLITTVKVPPFVTFHFINAYEERDSHGIAPARIIIDCCEHEANPEIILKLNLDNLRSIPRDVLPDARVGRFVIPLDGSPEGMLEAAVPPEAHGRGLDMATINPLYTSRKYQYLYACGAHRPTHFPNMLSKIDLVNKRAVNWYEKDSIPSEPFFVPKPNGVCEDDGIVISIISSGDGGGFIVVLDGPSFKEIARAPLPYGLPYGLHGCWVPRKE